MKTFKLPIALKVHDCVIDLMQVSQYDSNGKLAVMLLCQTEYDPEAHEPYAVLSTNIVEQEHILDDGEFFFKNYSENEKIFDAFMLAGYAERCGGGGTAGFAGGVPICRLTEKAMSIPLED